MKQFQKTPLTEREKSFGKECDASTTTEERLVVKRRRSKQNLRDKVGTVMDSINSAMSKRRNVTVRVTTVEKFRFKI
ncbi:hypothetical protein Bca52824_027596 [Brassica carinata]|uniref:Uncharacterized protein n=1 Tax=Brassica carinata TaxID=52824 RepID=A0A8X7VAR9_BRACI|nr:hypothetical protein Bca52824_027596 [Brassica carinata]